MSRYAPNLVVLASLLAACIEQDPAWLGVADGGSTDGGSTDGGSTDGGSTDGGSETGTDTDPGTDTGPEPDLGDESAGVCDDCPWWDPAWSHRSYLDADASEVGSDVADMQVLVTLTPTRFDYAAAAADGSDLRFVTDDGTVLAHELERWAPGETSLAWVRADLAGGASTRLWLYYGNAAATDAADPASVWAGHGGVWHLDDLRDTSGNGHDGSSGGDVAVDGPIGGARGFDGFGAHVLIGVVPELQYTGDLTIAAWFQVESLDQDSYSNVLLALGAAGEMQASNALYGINLDPSGDIWVFWEAAGAYDVDLRSTEGGEWEDGAWHHLVVTRELASSSVRFYLDGQSLGGPVGWGMNLEPSGGSNSELRFGADPADPMSWNLDGGLDEVRLAPLVEGPERVFLRYLAESDALLTYGAPQAR